MVVGNGLLGLKNIPQRVTAGARDVRGSAAFLVKSMASSEGRAAIREVGSQAAKKTAIAAGSGVKRAAVNTTAAAGTAIKQNYDANLAKAQNALADKAAAFAANPVASSWRGAKTAAVVGAVGLATVVTGGLALPVAAVVVAGRQRIERKERRATSEKNMLSEYRQHVSSQAQANAAEQRIAHDTAVMERFTQRAKDTTQPEVQPSTAQPPATTTDSMD